MQEAKFIFPPPPRLGIAPDVASPSKEDREIGDVQ